MVLRVICTCTYLSFNYAKTTKQMVIRLFIIKGNLDNEEKENWIRYRVAFGFHLCLAIVPL